VGENFSLVTDTETIVNENVTPISCVIAGLDPAIHGAAPRVVRVSMDHRVKPGGDESEQRIDWLRLIRSPSSRPVLRRKRHKPRGPQGRVICGLAP
jgi:hypothetical protein